MDKVLLLDKSLEKQASLIEMAALGHKSEEVKQNRTSEALLNLMGKSDDQINTVIMETKESVSSANKEESKGSNK